jgi:hypothetical protein
MSDIGDLLAEISAMQRESDRPAEGLRGVPWQEENQRTHGTPQRDRRSARDRNNQQSFGNHFYCVGLMT